MSASGKRRRGRLPPEAMYPAGDPVARSRFLDLDTGVRLRIVEAGPATGEPVILLHGWGASAYMYRFLLRDLAAAGLHGIATDLRGHGLSDKPSERGSYTRDQFVGDMQALTRALDLAAFGLVGQSTGGGIALALAATAPAQVRRLVLINPVGLVPVRAAAIGRVVSRRVLRPLAPFMAPRALVAALLAHCYGDRSRMTERDVLEYWAPSQDPEYVRAMGALLREFDWAPMPDEQLARVSMPTLLVSGACDRVIPRTARRVHSLPNAELLLVPDAGHVAHEELPDLLNGRIVAHLAG